MQTEPYGGFAHGGDGFLMQGGAGDDAAGADVFTGQFELRLDQDQEICRVFCDGQCGGKHFADGDEGDVEDQEISGLGDVGGAELAGVAADADDAVILAEFPGELVEIDVDRVDAGGAALQEAIGETAGGCADIDAGERVGIDGEVFQRAFQFKAAAADEFTGAGGDLDA